MAVTGPKPKSREQIRHRVKPVHDWTEVPNVAFDGGPPLPRLTPSRRRSAAAHEPKRPLGAIGRDCWDTLGAMSRHAVDEATLLVLCEQLDERAALRVRVLRDNMPAERHELRLLDAQVLSALGGWQMRHEPRSLVAWPVETRRWWRSVSTMPHAAIWTPSDWQAALDTAHLHAHVTNGGLRHLTELRVRERALGLTADARRDLRIRYVDQVSDEHDPTVTAMADYRRALGEQ